MSDITFLFFYVTVFLMNVGSLGKTGLLFMDRLCHQDSRVICIEVKEQWRAISHHGDELFIPHPCRVE